MTNIKRYLLFFLVNILVMSTIGIFLSFLGIGNYLTAYGINYQSLMIFCLVWGMAGSFISLFMSKFMVKRLYRMQEIPAHESNYGYITRSVHLYAKQAGLSKMPEVMLYDSPEVNAFATGPSKNNSLVAVSSGLISNMTQDEVEGVLAHEVAHVANGDMVTMALAQGVVNAFVMFLSRAGAFAISQAMRGDDEEGEGLGPFAHMALVWILDIVFGILSLPVLMWFSRYREYRADADGARLAGREKMVAALERLKGSTQMIDNSEPNLAAFKISGSSKMMEWFSSHPPLEKRIQALRR